MDREALIEQLDAVATWDVLVIGGGATGLGVGLDAAARGYQTVVLEQGDFAQATSSRSTKLIHGGVRYLQQGNVALVMEALHERGRLLHNAPHLVYNQAFVVPDYKWWERPFYGVGLKLYDMLAGKLGFGRSRMLSRSQTLEHIPQLRQDGLRGGVIYHDGQFDDTRLAVTLAQTMVDQGGCALNHVQVTEVCKDAEGVVQGVVCQDRISGREYRLNAKVVVNAAGIFVDEIRRMDVPDCTPLIAPSQGVHLVLDNRFDPGETAIMVPHTDDGRIIFMVPWHGRVLVGTTETSLESVVLEPRPLPEEIEFLLSHASRYLDQPVHREDILSVFAGIRPLIAGEEAAKTSSLSRGHHLTVSHSGLVTIGGGKWTTYRKMAEDTVDTAAQFAGLEERPCPTQHMRLHGWTAEADSNDFLSLYGTDRAAIESLMRTDPDLADRIHPRLPYRKAEVVWGTRQESARTVADILAHRTRALLLDARASMEAAPEVARLMARELSRDEEWQAAEIARYCDKAAFFYPE